MTDDQLDAALAAWHADPATQRELDGHIRRLGEPHRSVIGMHARGLSVGVAVFRSGRAPGPNAIAVARALLLGRLAHPQVGLSETGNRAGETHHRAKLTDSDIAQILALHEAGLGYRAIAGRFDDIPGGLSRSTVRDVIKLRRRNCRVVAFKRA